MINVFAEEPDRAGQLADLLMAATTWRRATIWQPHATRTSTPSRPCTRCRKTAPGR
jgi:hypothetical protein